MRNRTNHIMLLAMAIFIWSSAAVLADDNEIFGVVTQTVEPNVLIVFDTSGSMESIVPSGATWGDTYNPGTTYREYDYYNDSAGWIDNIDIILNEDSNQNGIWDYNDNEDEVYVYYSGSWRQLTLSYFTYSDSLTVGYSRRGYWRETTLGAFKDQLTNLTNGGWVTINGDDFAVGNWINWHKSRNETAISAIQNIIGDHGGSLRFGIMRFDGSSNGGYLLSYNSTQVNCSLKDSYILDADGDKLTGAAYDTAIANYIQFLQDAVGTLPASGGTPLAETLAEAGLYFAEKNSWFGNGNYANIDHYPMQYRCRQNYIILMTDGEPTSDTDPLLYTGTYINGDQIRPGDSNRALLYHVSEYLYENDCNGNLDGDQNIVTYTIGFNGGDPVLLQTTADKGQGESPGEGLYFPATSQQSLEEAFEAFIGNINERKTTFTSSVVPISDVNQAYAGDSVYMSLFQPLSGSSRWAGNLKKYKLDSDVNVISCDTGDPIMDSAGEIKETARSCWSTSDDGQEVRSGGAGEVLIGTDDSSRHIYSNISSTTTILSNSANEFSTSNTELEPSLLGAGDTTARNEIINKVRMVGEDWQLGDLNHSKPTVVNYTSGTYIFVGSNDGMLHCFDDSNGSEKWAFLPKEQFSRITDAYTGDHSYFMDGSATVAQISSSKTILMIGERRGGNHYYALDISDIDNPKYLYTRTVSGQSWKQPEFMTVKTGSGTEQVFLLTGGYDDGYDDNDSLTSPVGDSVVMIDVETNAAIETFDSSDLPAMTNSIVMAAGADMVDDGEDIVSQIYAGDLEGQLFAFRDNDNEDYPAQLNGVWSSLHLFTATSSGKKIFEEVDFTPEFIRYWDSEGDGEWKSVVGDYVYFGTGDRAHPLRTDTTNYFYCVKNDWRTGGLSPSTKVSSKSTLYEAAAGDGNEYVLLDVTDDDIQDGTAAEKQAVKDTLNKNYNRGWYIQLEGVGEKCLSSPIIYAGVVYFTTFTPANASGPTSVDPCEDPTSGGTAKLYAVDYKTGAAVFNFTTSNDTDEKELGKADRHLTLSSSSLTIPPSPVIVISASGPPKLLIGGLTGNVRDPKRGVDQFYWLQLNE